MRHSLFLILCVLLSPVTVATAASPLEGRWRLDPAHSSALDGWTAWDLLITVNGAEVTLQHDMQWRSTKVTGTNILNTTQPTTTRTFFRVDQRHMGVYPQKEAETSLRAHWLDAGRTLQLEANTPVEISQGRTTMRLSSEYRVLEGNTSLLLIELHQSRPRPLVYRFTKVEEGK
ncbi:MAG: hypothetical protein ABIZ04_08205 [Opitutus sp.]